MNILYTFNDGFVPQVGAGITSVCMNNKKAEKIHFYLLYFDATEENKNELEKLVHKYKREVTIIELNSLDEYFDFDFDTNGWNPIVLSRLLLDKILPKNLGKILYLDGDTIVRGSLDELWNMDFDGKTIGMSIEPTIDKGRIEILELGDRPYYNAGVLMVDLKRWRKIHAGDKIIKYYKKFDGKLFANDQDAINGELQHEIYPLDLKYNYCNTYYFYPYSAIRKMIGNDSYYSKEYYEEMVKDPYIVHYLGEERPWREGNCHVFREDFTKYYNMTYYGKHSDRDDGVFELGWKRYYAFWNLFNKMMKPFPMLRLKIINTLIPLVLDLRKKKK